MIRQFRFLKLLNNFTNKSKKIPGNSKFFSVHQVHLFQDLFFSIFTYNMKEQEGYWLPHTSSIDFCEPNYIISPYVAEFHNSWSSALIAVMGLIGIVYGNPLKEWSVTIMFLILTVVGVGSIGLHSTLHWFPQSSDEIPMLWLILSSLYILIISQYPSLENSNLCYLFLLVGAVQTYLYYCYRSIYGVFLVSIIVYCTVLDLWIFYLNLTRYYHDSICFSLGKGALASFLLCGFSVWLVDMNYCDPLLPYYLRVWGLSFHVMWHIFAGYGAYLLGIYLIYVRLKQLKLKNRMKWILYVFPTFELEENQIASPKTKE
jgi:dihydroceramidase